MLSWYCDSLVVRGKILVLQMVYTPPNVDIEDPCRGIQLYDTIRNIPICHEPYDNDEAFCD